MSSVPPPPNPICTRRQAKESDPDAPPRVTETRAPPPSSARPPLMASEVRVGSPSHRAAQGSDTEHPDVAEAPSAVRPSTDLAAPKQMTRPSQMMQASGPAGETLAPSPSAAHPSTDQAPPKQRPKFRFKFEIPPSPTSVARTSSELALPKSKTRQVASTSRVVQGSDLPVETAPPLPFATPKPHEPRRNPPRGASMKARDASSKSTAMHAHTHHHGAKSRTLASSSYWTGQPAGLAFQGHSAASLTSNDVEDASATAVPCEEVSSEQNVEKEVSSQILTEPVVREKKFHQISPHLQLIVSNLSKTWSRKVDLAMDGFRTTIEGCSAEKKPWQEIVNKASANLAETLNRIQDEQSRSLIDELSKEPDSCTFGMKKLALIYDERMLLHRPPNPRFDEKPSRLTSIINHLKKHNLLDRCDLFGCEEVAVELLSAVHSLGYIEDIQSLSSKDQQTRDLMASEHCEQGDIYYSEGSDTAAFLAAGGAIKACSLVAEHKYQYSFAIIRPPGHHAGPEGPSGFCLFNNVSTAASYLIDHHQMKKIMIIDWDVHHGNGTEEIFYKDERVLFFSLHRYEEKFYPFAPVGSVMDIGEGSGAGFNLNFCWPHNKIRDIDYLTVWEHILVPLVEEFKPEIILISAGFDAAEGDPLGGCCVTPSGYAALLNMILRFGPVVMVLEGGYNLQCISQCAAACVRVLLGDPSVIPCDTDSLPYDTTWKTILEIRELFRKFWKAFESEIPQEVISKSMRYSKMETMPCSAKAEGSRRKGRSKKIG